MTFLDSNIPIYSVDPTEPDKRIVASAIMEKAIETDGFCVSAQVHFEFANVCSRKFKMTAGEILAMLDEMRCIHCIDQTPDMVRQAVNIRTRYGISMQDALIIAAAEKSGCDELLTEDLNDGQVYAGVRVRNPFK